MEVYNRVFLKQLSPYTLDMLEGSTKNTKDRLDGSLKPHVKRSKRRDSISGIFNTSIVAVEKNISNIIGVFGQGSSDGSTYKTTLKFDNLEVNDLGAYLLAFRIARSRFSNCKVLIINETVTVDIREIKEPFRPLKKFSSLFSRKKKK